MALFAPDTGTLPTNVPSTHISIIWLCDSNYCVAKNFTQNTNLKLKKFEREAIYTFLSICLQIKWILWVDNNHTSIIISWLLLLYFLNIHCSTTGPSRLGSIVQWETEKSGIETEIVPKRDGRRWRSHGAKGHQARGHEGSQAGCSLLTA